MNNDQLRKLLDNNHLDIDNAVKTIGKFQKGDLKPLITSMEHYNNASLGGIIPGLITSIGARPSHGKSHTLHQIKNTSKSPRKFIMKRLRIKKSLNARLKRQRLQRQFFLIY